MKNEARKQWRGGSIMSQDWFSPKELAGLPGMPGTPHPGELRAAAWEEIDLEEGIWRVPPERMKTGRPHRVPCLARPWPS
jgi:integrase